MNVGTIYADLRFRTTKLKADLATANAQMHIAQANAAKLSKQFAVSASSMQATGKKMTMAVTLPIVALAGASTKFGLDFAKSIGYANTMLKLSEPELNKFKQGVLGISNQYGKSATDVARSAYSISSVLHTSGKDTLTILGSIAKASKAGKIQTEEAGNAIVRMMSIYNIKAKDTMKLVDTMSATVKAGNANWQDLAQVLPQAAGAGKILGVSIEELSGAFAAMSSKSGSAEMAGTALRAVMMAMIKPSDEMTKAINAMGYTSAQAAIKQIGLIGVVDKLRVKYGNNAEALGKLIPNVRGITGASILFANKGKDLAESLAMVRDSTGETNKQMKAGETISGRFTETMNRLKNAGIELFSSFEPYLEEALKYITNLTKKFEGLSPQVKNSMVKIAGLIAIIGPLLWIGGKAIQMINSFKMGLIMLRPLMAAFGITTTASLAPILPIILAITAATALLVVAWKKDWGGIQEKTKAFLEFFNGVSKTIGEKMEVIKAKLSGLRDKARTAFEKSKRYALSFADKMGNVVKTLREKIPLVNDYFKVWETGLNIIKGLFEKFKKKAESVLNSLRNKITQFFNDMRDKGKSQAEKQQEDLSKNGKALLQYYGDEYYIPLDRMSKKAKNKEIENQKQIASTTLRIRKETVNIAKNLTQEQIDKEMALMAKQREQKERQAWLDAEKQKYLAAKTACYLRVSLLRTTF